MGWVLGGDAVDMITSVIVCTSHSSGLMLSRRRGRKVILLSVDRDAVLMIMDAILCPGVSTDN